jgi:hypothetical protein
MQNRQHFRTDYPAAPLMVHGSLLNRYGGALNGLLPPLLSSYSNYSGLSNGSAGRPPFVFGVATITDADNTCQSIPEESETGPPCKQEHKYKCKFRYWNGDDQTWQDLDTELRLDAGAYFVRDAGQGILGLFEGEVLPAFYDPVREWVVPLISPPLTRWGVLTETLNAQDTATAREIWWDESTWALGDEFEVRDPWLNAGETVENGTRLVATLRWGIWVPTNYYCEPADNLPN